MAEQRNIVILGASFAGIQAAQYITKHTLPALKAKHEAKYHVYVISPTSDFYFRVASPRVATSTSLIAAERICAPISEIFKDCPADDFTFIQASATGLDTAARKVLYRKNSYLQDEKLSYHALIVATGSKTHHPAFSMSNSKEETIQAIETMNAQVSTAKDIIVVGGGPTGVETAGELGEYLNGRPGWFSTPPRKANITLLTAGDQLLPTVRAAIGKEAENKLKALGVDVVYNTRVADVADSEDGRKIVTLAKGEKLETDIYIPAHGIVPNSSFLPSNLLNKSGYLKTNSSTLRVDEAGPRVYALGDISDASRNTVMDLNGMLPVVFVNLKRDLLSFDPSSPNIPVPGKDRVFEPTTKELMMSPIGSAGGVGVVFGWRVPNWFVWILKARDFMINMSMKTLVSGDTVKKEVKWTAEEAVA